MPDAVDRTGSSSPPRSSYWRRWIAERLIDVCVVVLVFGGLFLLTWPACRTVIEATDRLKVSMKLQQIGLAIHNYNDVNGELPTNTYAPDGTPLLSWRVHLLPYVDANDLYKEFKLDEPWNSPHNIRLLDWMPEAYRHPRQPDELRSKTCYRGFSNPGAVFERRPRNLAMALLGGPIADMKTRFRLANLKDPLSETFLVVEAAEFVEWTRPNDLDAAPDKPFPALGGHRRRSEYFGAVMCDGAARTLPIATDETKLRALVSHSGGEKTDP